MKRIQMVAAASIAVLFTLQGSAATRRSSRNLKPLTGQIHERQPKIRGAHYEKGKKTEKTESPESLREDAPSEKGNKTVTRTLFLGPKTGWGFLKIRGSYFTPEGKNLGKLPAGTLFKYKGTKNTPESTVLISTIRRPDGRWDGPFLLDCRDIATYEGDLATIDPVTIENLEKYFSLSGKIRELKEEIKNKALRKNPYYLSMQAMQKAFQTSVEKAAQLEKEMLETTGKIRSRLEDKLRALKYEQIKIKAKQAAMLQAYRAWEAANPFDIGLLKNDPQLNDWQRELDTARAPVKDLIPKEDE